MPEKENRPAGNGAANQTTGCNHYIASIGRRREASRRVQPLDCGCTDPWTCKHHNPVRDADRQAEAAIAAGDHLLHHNLGPLYDVDTGRALWRAGRRDLAVRTASQVVA